MIEKAIDGIGNLVDLPRLMFINEECGNLQVVVFMVESLVPVYQKVEIRSFTSL